MAGLAGGVLVAASLLAGPGASDFQPAPAYTVSGRVVFSTGVLPPTLTVMIHKPTPTGSEGRSCDLSPDSRFVARDLTPGTYILEAGPMADPAGHPPGVPRGFAVVTIRDADVDGVVIDAAPGATVRGRVRFDEARGSSSRPSPVNVQAMLALTDWHGPAETALMADDGTFELRDLRGPRVIRVGYGLAADGNPWWFSQVLLGERDITNEAVDFSAAPAGDLVLVFTQRPSAVVGRVEDVAGLPMSGACVVLLPEDADLQVGWSTAVGAREADQRGRFYFTSMPPGEYHLAAYEAARCPTAGEVLDLADDIERVGTTVQIGESAVARVILPGASRPLRP